MFIFVASFGPINFCFVTWFSTALTPQFFPTAEEAIGYYNQKRCVDGKALVLPSQIVSQFLI